MQRASRAVTVLVLAVLGAHLSASQASAAPPRHFEETQGPFIDVLQPCGAVSTWTRHLRGRLHLTASGEFIRLGETQTYIGTIEYDGQTYRLTTHQNFTAKLLASGELVAVLNGQGTFIRLPGQGVVWHDTGHLVFDPLTGETIHKSARVVGNDEFDFDAYSAAVCAALQR